LWYSEPVEQYEWPAGVPGRTELLCEEISMHVPDHYLNPAVMGACAAAVTGLAVGAGVGLRRGTVAPPRVGLLAATSTAVFGLQMLNFPVSSGTSGHLMGGALAASLLGPVWGSVAITLVLAVQAFFFADGGISALGVNTLLMAVCGTWVAWWVGRALTRWLPVSWGRSKLVLAASVGGVVSVVASAVLFTLLYAVGGQVAAPLGEVAAAMIPVHGLIGLGDGLLTGGVMAAVLALAPQVSVLGITAVAGAAPAGELTGEPLGELVAAVPPANSQRVRAGLVLVVAAVLAAAIAVPWASELPDGLEAAAAQLGLPQ
jgi:cobalt/nickel transport system permease protein